MLLGLCFTAPLLANEVLRIESQAAEYSAQIYIQEEEKGSVPEKEKENDQKRKKLGIGETVFLILVSDKPSSLETHPRSNGQLKKEKIWLLFKIKVTLSFKH